MRKISLNISVLAYYNASHTWQALGKVQEGEIQRTFKGLIQ